MAFRESFYRALDLQTSLITLVQEHLQIRDLVHGLGIRTAVYSSLLLLKHGDKICSIVMVLNKQTLYICVL